MEKRSNVVTEGLTRLPPGFRFQPTDEELLFQYLRCKLYSLPLPAYIIPELHFCNFDPWDLPGNPEEERYFFTKKEVKYRRGSRSNRATSSGYWKATGSDKHISPPPRQSLGMIMKGLRKTFVFNMGKSPNGRRTCWYMHEYSLILNVDHQKNEVEDWVICCLFMRQRPGKDYDDTATSLHYGDNHIDTSDAMTFYGSLTNNVHSWSSSSSSNSIIEVSANGSDEYDEETTSHYFR